MTVSGYATDNVLVDADWAKAHLDDPNVRFVEVDVDTTAYDQSHLPGAIGWNWTSQLADGIRRDIASREEFSKLLSDSGIGPDTTIALYGDNNNWFAAWAYWQLKLFGHRDVRIINGGRKFWLDNGLPLSTDVPSSRTVWAHGIDAAPGMWPARCAVSVMPGGAMTSPLNSAGDRTSTSASSGSPSRGRMSSRKARSA